MEKFGLRLVEQLDSKNDERKTNIYTRREIRKENKRFLHVSYYIVYGLINWLPSNWTTGEENKQKKKKPIREKNLNLPFIQSSLFCFVYSS